MAAPISQFDPLSLAALRLELPATPVSLLYESPENILEVTVTCPRTHVFGSEKFTDYELTTRTNVPAYPFRYANVRRRYREFARLRKMFITEMPNVKMPELPDQMILGGRFTEEIIAERREGLEIFIQ